MTTEDMDGLTSVDIPKAGSLIGPPCEQELTIRGKLNTIDKTLVPRKFVYHLTSRDIPDPSDAIIAAGGNIFTVRGKGNTADSTGLLRERIGSPLPWQHPKADR